MHINDSLKNFLFDLNYFITIYEDFIYVFNYDKIEKISEKEVTIKFNKFTILIKGFKLTIEKMTKKELKIGGSISNLEFKYE